MRITVISINEDEAVLVRGTSALGVRGKFGCPVVVGDVIFIASRGFEDNLRTGNTITVETGYESLSDIQSVELDGAANAELMEPAGEPGDYMICGRVVSVVAEVVRVAVRGLMFDLGKSELGSIAVHPGSGLRFKLHRLCFWDTAI